MNTLLTIDLDSTSDIDRVSFRLRQAARAVVFDEDGNIALLHVQTGGYYKTPGGGIEPGEDILTALKRECLEEIGCEIEVDKELGRIIEYRARFDLKQESFCYLAHVVGEKGEPQFTDEEIKEGLRAMWVSMDQAFGLIRGARLDVYPGEFITKRELAILEEVKKRI